MTDSLWRKRQEPEALKRITRDDTEHDRHYYLADEVDALLAQPEQPTPKWQGARFDSALHDQPPQPEQEPVALVTGVYGGRFTYAPFKQSVLLPVGMALYMSPPQRKPLTENEIKHLWYEACQTNLELTSQLIVHLARNIEAAHGIKD